MEVSYNVHDGNRCGDKGSSGASGGVGGIRRLVAPGGATGLAPPTITSAASEETGTAAVATIQADHLHVRHEVLQVRGSLDRFPVASLVQAVEVHSLLIAVADWRCRVSRISAKLERDPNIKDAPSPSTGTRILQRNGCIESSKPNRRRSHPRSPLPIKPNPNATWSADFKGEFRMRDAQLCYPLTVQEGGWPL